MLPHCSVWTQRNSWRTLATIPGRFTTAVTPKRPAPWLVLPNREVRRRTTKGGERSRASIRSSRILALHRDCKGRTELTAEKFRYQGLTPTLIRQARRFASRDRNVHDDLGCASAAASTLAKLSQGSARPSCRAPRSDDQIHRVRQTLPKDKTRLKLLAISDLSLSTERAGAQSWRSRRQSRRRGRRSSLSQAGLFHRLHKRIARRLKRCRPQRGATAGNRLSRTPALVVWVVWRKIRSIRRFRPDPRGTSATALPSTQFPFGIGGPRSMAEPDATWGVLLGLQAQSSVGREGCRGQTCLGKRSACAASDRRTVQLFLACASLWLRDRRWLGSNCEL